VNKSNFRIGLWGATQSGKTTFLAALGLATLRAGGWQVFGASDNGKLNADSQIFLETNTAALIRGQFPTATAANLPYHWTLRGDLGGPPIRKIRRKLEGDLNKVAFDLEVIDVPGRLFAGGDSPEDSPLNDADWPEVLAHFAACDGLVYLHDPLNEENFHYVHGLLGRLAGALEPQGRLIDHRRLPHYLAVCVTKFDDPEVFERAWEVTGGKIELSRTPPHSPLPKDPKAYFELIADRMVVNALRDFFDHRRVGYFATSAIGFQATDGMIDLGGIKDYTNVRHIDGRPEILSKEIHPLNVLEPLIWLERQSRLGRRRWTRRLA